MGRRRSADRSGSVWTAGPCVSGCMECKGKSATGTRASKHSRSRTASDVRLWAGFVSMGRLTLKGLTVSAFREAAREFATTNTSEEGRGTAAAASEGVKETCSAAPSRESIDAACASHTQDHPTATPRAAAKLWPHLVHASALRAHIALASRAKRCQPLSAWHRSAPACSPS